MLELKRIHSQLKALASEAEAERSEALRFFKAADAADWESAPADQVAKVVREVQQQLAAKPRRPAVRQALLAVLGNIGPRAKAALPEMIEMLQDKSSDGTREAAAVAIGRLGAAASGAAEALVESLTEARSAFGGKILRALAESGASDKRTKAALLALWDAPELSEFGRFQVAYALCKLQIETTRLYRFLSDALVGHKETQQRKAAAEALGWCEPTAPDVVPALLVAALKDKNDEVKELAEASLEQMKLTRAKAIRICAQQLGTSPFAEAALRNCGDAALADLTEAAKSTDAKTCETAVRTLGGLGEAAASAAPTIAKLLSNPRFDVRLSAAKSLWNITKTPEMVVPVLIDLLHEKWFDASAGPEARRQAMQTVIESLWRIGPAAEAAVPALARKAKDSNRSISESAQNAIQKIAPLAKIPAR